MSINFNKLKPATLGLDSVLDFGRHFGYNVLEVLKDRPQYIQWLIKEGKNFYPSVHIELAGFLDKQRTARYVTRSEAWNCFSDQDDWFDDVPF